MKRCPKCNRTYPIETQKFCTHDGEPLVTFETAGAETIRIDSPTLAGGPSKTISPQPSSEPFDPYKTVIDRPQQPVATPPRTPDDPYKTVAGHPQQTIPPLRVTQDLPEPTSGALTGSASSAPTIPSLPQKEPSPPQTSAPPAPGQAVPMSGFLPSSGSGPIESSAPQPSSVKSQPFAPRAGAARRAEKSTWPLVLGVLALLFIFGMGIITAAYFAFRRSQAARRSSIATPAETPRRRVVERTPVAEEAPPNQSSAGPEQAPFVAPPNSVEFVNSKDNLDGKLAEHYVDFSFYYPENWKKDPAAGIAGARNFVKVERRLPPDFTQESFTVGMYASTGAETRDREAYPRLMEARSAEFSKTVPEYDRVSEGPAKVGVYNGYELRFQGLSRNTAKGDIKIWGRVVFLPPPDGGKNGVTLLMLATSLAPELKSVDDLGEKGELPVILKSFRFGTK